MDVLCATCGFRSNIFAGGFAHARNLTVAPDGSVFLAQPGVQMDTNHLERALRPIAIGRKNWMFCSTEVGASQVGVIQSLLVTCRLHGLDAYTYLVDVLQRVQIHPAKRVQELTPRLWAENFALAPMRSVLFST